jgi:hypothetical protein
MAIGRISGPLLKSNLLRRDYLEPDQANLAFETDLLYLDVINGRVGIKTTSPAHELQIVGTTRTTNLEVTTQADIATFTISGDTIASSSSTINLEPSGSNPVIYQAKILVDDNLQLFTNSIETTVVDSNLEIRTNGTGQVNINSNVYVDGNLHATGNITADGDITIGDDSTDNIVFNADVASNIVPNTTNLYDLGSDPALGGKEWRTVYANTINADVINSNNINVNGIDLALPQGNIYYVSTEGSDSNAGNHEHAPFLTLKYALDQVSSGDTVYIYPGVYQEIFPITVPAGVTIKGAGIRAVRIVPTTESRYNDAFLLNGDITIEDITVADFFSGGNYFSVVTASSGSVTFNAGTAPFAHTYVSGGTITVNSTEYAVISATYDYTTGDTTVTHSGGIATGTIFLSGLTFSCNGSTRVFPDNGYAFRFASGLVVTTRSPYIRNCTVLTKGSVTSPSDPLGFDEGDAGKGAYIDGAYANSASKEASMLFHSVTLITPNVDTITAKNGVRIEWLNSFTYYANRGIYAFSSNYGFAQQGKTRLRIDNRVGTWNVGNTLSYYDTDGVTVLASGVIDSIDSNFVNLTGRCLGFETITDRAGKTAYANGNAKLSTTAQKFGPTSLSVDGVNSYVSISPQPDFNFENDDFTIECWIYPTAIPTEAQYSFIAGQSKAGAGNTSCGLYLTSTSGVTYLYSMGTFGTLAGGVISQNTWTHIALTRENDDFKLWINGVQSGSTLTYSGAMTSASSTNFTIGGNAGFNLYFTGYIDDLRVSKGVSRYSSTFTPSSIALTGDLSTVLLLHFNGSNNSTVILDDGITLQDLRTSAGGTGTLINFADYSDFGAEIRSIGSACIYGNYGVYGDGPGVIAYLISQNFAYVGAGKLTTNDPNDRIDANEIIELNDAKIYYTSVDNEGNFKVGDNFYVNQKTGEVIFNNQSLSVTSLTGVTFTDGVHTTIVTAEDITTGNIRIYDNNIDSLTGDVNITAASGVINLQNDTYITGNLDVTGDVTIGGNIQIGDNSADDIDFIGSINSDLIPATTSLYNLGSDLLRWNTAFLSRIEIDNLVIDSNTISTTNSNDDLILIANGTGRIYIPESDVEIDQNLTVTTDLTVTTGTSYLKNISVIGTITHIGDYNQTGNFTTSGTAEITGNIIGTGYVQLPNIRIENNVISTTTTDTDLELIANGAGNVIVEGIKFDNNYIKSVSTNSNIVLTPQGTGSVIVNSNQSLIIPVGTTAERPLSPTNGMIRFNTSLSRYEGYNNGYWLQLSGVIDNSGNTRILAEATPGANDNTLYFYANNNLTATIDSTKLFTQRLQTTQLDLNGNTITTISPNTDINLTTAGTGGVKIGNLRIRNNTITNTVSGAITVFEELGSGYIKIAGVNGVVIPAGDTEFQRPAVPETGMIRFNIDQDLVEVYNGVSWGSVAGTTSGVTTPQANEIGISAALIFG